MYLFILDLDGTVLGDVRFQVAKYSLHQSLRRHGFRPAASGPVPHAFHQDMHLIRPGFGNWMKSMKKRFPDSHFFVYTASEKAWAKVEVPWIEKSLGVQFSRPIFTRDDCLADPSVFNYRKSLTRILPKIWKSVGKKLTAAEKATILQTRTMIVDNTSVFVDHTDHLLLCPDYAYTVFEDVLDGVPPALHDATMVLALMNQGLVCPNAHNKADPVKGLAHRYQWLAKRCHAVTHENQSHVNDQFWRALRKLIAAHNVVQFTGTTVKALQERVWSAVASP